MAKKFNYRDLNNILKITPKVIKGVIDVTSAIRKSKIHKSLNSNKKKGLKGSNTIILEKETNYYYIKKIKDSYGLKQITNFLVKVNSKILDLNNNITREIILINREEVSDPFTITSDYITSSIKFTNICLDKGNFVFEGNDSELKELWKYILNKEDNKKINLVNNIGFCKAKNIWIFKNFAIKDNRLIRKTEDEIFWFDKDSGLKFINLAENIPLPNLKEIDDNFDLIEALNETESLLNKNLGFYKGSLLISYIISNVYSYEIYKAFGFFPILFIYGKFQSGKNFFAELIMNFFGMTAQNMTSIAESTQTGISRMMSFYSYIPFWIDEYRANDYRFKDMDGYFRNIFNKVNFLKSEKGKDDIKKFETNANLILTGEEIPTDPALRSRCFFIGLSKKDRDDSYYYEVNSLRENFSKITTYLILNKSSISIENLLESIKKLKEEYISLKVDNRKAEIYSVMLGSYLLVKNNLDYQNWFSEELKKEKLRSDKQSVLEKFWRDLEYLTIDKDIDAKKYIFLDERKNLVYLWFDGIYRLIAKKYLYKKSFFAEETFMNLLNEEPYYVDSFVKQSLGGCERDCIVLRYDECPDSLKKYI